MGTCHLVQCTRDDLEHLPRQLLATCHVACPEIGQIWVGVGPPRVWFKCEGNWLRNEVRVIGGVRGTKKGLYTVQITLLYTVWSLGC